MSFFPWCMVCWFSCIVGSSIWVSVYIFCSWLWGLFSYRTCKYCTCKCLNLLMCLRVLWVIFYKSILLPLWQNVYFPNVDLGSKYLPKKCLIFSILELNGYVLDTNSNLVLIIPIKADCRFCDCMFILSKCFHYISIFKVHR